VNHAQDARATIKLIHYDHFAAVGNPPRQVIEFRRPAALAFLTGMA